MRQVQQAISKRELEMANGSQEHQARRQRFKGAITKLTANQGQETNLAAAGEVVYCL